MKERPILFSAPMVRAILDGSKTQTRRIAKVTPDQCEDIGLFYAEYPCPYGQPGDRLWVRETFHHEPADYCWEASVSIPARQAHTAYRADFDGDTAGYGWKPSIHMPRKLSRINLEITAVRVERLQEISEEDCWAEGIEEVMNLFDRDSQITMSNRLGCCIDDAKPLYAQLWESINGAGSWDANPWVWVVEFRKLNADQA